MNQKKPGRQSRSELAVSSVVLLDDRPEPPLDLNPRAESEWLRVVNKMPSDWFGGETLSLLGAYCQHVAEGECLQVMIDRVRPSVLDDDDAMKLYEKLSRQKKLNTDAMLSLSRSMRLTQQSSYTAKTSATAKATSSNGVKPWNKR